MNILITGIHGFVGSNLVVSLSKEHQLYGLDIVTPQKEGVIATYSWEDLSKGKIPEVDAIIHLAGKAHDLKNKSQSDTYFKINTGLTQVIFDYFLASTTKKFIFFSSVKAAADFVSGDILTEDIKPCPIGPYGESKIKAEEYILSKTIPADKSIYILRPCMIHGPGNKGNLNLLYSIVSKGIPWPLGAFENRRSFTSVGNLCFVINGLLTKEIESGIYHMGDDDALSTNELIAVVCKAMGRKAHIWKINKGFMTFCAKVGGILHLPLNPDRLNKLTENYVVSNAKIKKALGIDKMPIKAEDGLTTTIRSFQVK
ncbi:NAD-dependent epimerase/dehydratase family protein [Bacteroides bouchesdurhonensis]